MGPVKRDEVFGKPMSEKRALEIIQRLDAEGRLPDYEAYLSATARAAQEISSSSPEPPETESRA